MLKRVFVSVLCLSLAWALGTREARAVQVLGTGTAALLGNDLTDLGDDGIETLYAPPGDYGNFDADFFSSDEPGFEGVEAAFNVFDNKLGPTNDKWCCGTQFPQIVGADFTNTQGVPFRLTHFTVSSANDAEDRDPRVWRIEGSNDGATWTTIFSQDDPNLSLWTERLQVVLFQEGRDYPVQEEAYYMFRMITDRTNLADTPGNAFFQVGEIEFFGEEEGAFEICNNGIDDDGDRLIDCADPTCASSPSCQKRFERGDADGSGSINITDGIYVLNYLFLGGDTPGCLDAADTNDDGSVNITDGIYILNYLFLGGAAPPPPHGTCGTDPTADETGCEKPHTQGNCA